MSELPNGFSARPTALRDRFPPIVGTPSVLCVYNHQNVRRALQRTLAREGVNVHLAESAREALALLAADEVQFQVIISDLHMPGMGGIELLAKVRDKYPRVQRIMLTAYGDADMIQKAINVAGVHRFHNIPWDMPAFFDTICECIDQWALLAERDRLEEITARQNDALQSLNQELESKVAQRTAELERKLAQRTAELESKVAQRTAALEPPRPGAATEGQGLPRTTESAMPAGLAEVDTPKVEREVVALGAAPSSPSRPASLYDVFIAYPSNEHMAATALHAMLASRLRVFLDSISLRPGDAWDTRLDEAQRGSRITIVIVPAATDDAYYAREEIARAIERQRDGDHRVVPLYLVGKSTPPTTPYGLRRLVGLFKESEGEWSDVARKIFALLEDGPRSHAPGTVQARLAEAQLRLAEARSGGGEGRSELSEVIHLKRELRSGGQVQCGDILGDRYHLAARIGRGGFANVWRAYDSVSRQIVAVKMLHSDHAGDTSRRERFFRGARVMAGFNHPAIVRIIEAEAHDDGFHYFSMEYAAGGDLHDAVLKGRLRGNEAVDVVLSVADALQYSHAAGTIHRDVKPANILLDAMGHAKLTDFDLVRAADTTGGTRTGALGTFIFAAPEALSDASSVSAACDVYSLTMTLVFCLYGKALPYEAVRRTDAFVAELCCGEALKSVLALGLEDVGTRYASVRDLAEAVRNARSEDSPGAGDRLTSASRSLLWYETADCLPLGDSHPVVAIIGSHQGINLTMFCEALGGELARAGVTVASRAHPGVGLLVSQAFHRVAQEGGRVKFFVTEKSKRRVSSFGTWLATGRTASETRRRFLGAADIAIVIAGADRTRQELEMAMELGLPTILVPTTGGVAAEAAPRTGALPNVFVTERLDPMSDARNLATATVKAIGLLLKKTQ